MQLVLCSPDRYDVFASTSASGPFYKLGDLNGTGQDHCTLVDPSFTMPDDATMTSRPNAEVMAGGEIRKYPNEFGVAFYGRFDASQPFTFYPDASTVSGAMTSCWYQCGVSF